jgi:hypothetical protein
MPYWRRPDEEEILMVAACLTAAAVAFYLSYVL